MNATDKFVKCGCQFCSGSIEFESEHAGETINCPHCGMETMLFIPPSQRTAKIPDPPKVPSAHYICEKCWSVCNPITFTPGNFLTEVILWMFFLIPGLCYSLWRLTSKRSVCQKCQGNVIPLGSPRGQALLKQARS